MFTNKKMRRVLLIGLGICLLLLTTACSSPAQASQSSGSLASASAPGRSTTGTIGGTDTNCPAPGTGRTAAMPPLQLGTDQAIVYIDAPSTLKHYDVQTGRTTTILNAEGSIGHAQISRDGQWILFTRDNQAIQLVRMDGKYLQTLYCAPPGQQIDPETASGYSSAVQWSPNQKQVIFSQGGSSMALYLLNLTNGNVQREITAQTAGAASMLQPRTWVDNTRVYITSRSSMYILDTSKGANQSFNQLQLIIGVSDFLWDFDSTYDASKLFTMFVDPTPGRAGPGTYCQILSSSVTQQGGELVFKSNTLAPNQVRVAGYGSSTLLLSVNQRADPADKYNGLWKVNTDGTGLVELTNLPNVFNMFGQYPWSNVSRDDRRYAYGSRFGSLNGGTPALYTTSDSAILVGWTTL